LSHVPGRPAAGARERKPQPPVPDPDMPSTPTLRDDQQRDLGTAYTVERELGVKP